MKRFTHSAGTRRQDTAGADEKSKVEATMKWTVGTKIGAGFALALLILIVIGAVAYRGTAKLTETADWVDHTHKVLEDLGGVIQGMTDIETGMRGFAITATEPYLEPYEF